MTRQMVMVGFPAGAELHEPAVLLAPSAVARRCPFRRLLPGDRAHPGSRQVPHGVLRRPSGHARPLRQRPRPHRRVRHPRHQDGPAHRAHDHGGGDDQAGARLDLLHHLLRAVRRRPPLRHARPDDERARGLERRDVRQRRRGPEHGAPGAPGSTTCATTRPTSSWRSCSGTGTLGTTAPSSSTRRPAATPTRPRSSGSTTRASTSPRAGRSRCRARRKAIR